MPVQHPVQTVTFDQDSLDSFIEALRTIGFVVTATQTNIDGINFTHHAKWMSAPFDDGLYFKFYESEYTPLYVYTYTAEQTYSGSTYDINQINEWRELYPDTFELLDTQDHTSSSFILVRLSKDNRDYENVITNYDRNKLTYAIVGTQGDITGASIYRMISQTGSNYYYGGNEPYLLSYKIPYVKTSNGGIVVLSVFYCEKSGSAVIYEKLPFAILPPDNSKDHWTSAFFYLDNQVSAYATYYNGENIWQSGFGSVSLSASGIDLLQPLEVLTDEMPHESPGHFYNDNVFIDHHYKIDNKIFGKRYGSVCGHSMGEIFKDEEGNEYYIFGRTRPFAIKL